MLTSRYASQLDAILTAPQSFKPLPQAKDSFWHQTVTPAMRKSYIALGEQYRGRPWQTIPDALFSEYSRNGNRDHYERECFERRDRLRFLVMAEVIEHNDRFLADINNGLHYFLTETWWGVPAHYPLRLPSRDSQVVDLFNAETAGLLAWTIYMLHDELETLDRNICQTVIDEINRRFLKPAQATDYEWKKKSYNWNPWICSNWLVCLLFCEPNRQQQVMAVGQILQTLDVFIDGYPDDGGCDEGIDYWNRAAASLYDCLNLLKLATNGAISLSNEPKIKAMASYVYKMYISNDTFINYADASPRARTNINVCYPFGKYVDDPIMMGYAAFVAQKQDYLSRPGTFFNWSGSLSRELFFLPMMAEFLQQKPIEPLIQDVWLPDLQLFSARSDGNSSRGLFVAAKGGHNDESHNHNDVGNFIVYGNGLPLLVDIGAATYTANTFNDQRYQQPNTRSAYHNVPIINGCEQHAGRQFRATSLKYTRKLKWARWSTDLASAYPSKAEVTQWTRTIRLDRNQQITVSERYRLKRYLAPSQITLICSTRPLPVKPGLLLITTTDGSYHLSYNPTQVEPQIEKIDYNDTVVHNSWGQYNLHRIRLSVIGTGLKGEITYKIQPVNLQE